MKRGKQRRGGDGCGFLLFACLMACVLLIINAVVLRTLYAWYLPQAPQFVQHPRFGRAVLFVGPLFMLVVQWALFDRIQDLVGRPPDEDEPKG